MTPLEYASRQQTRIAAELKALADKPPPLEPEEIARRALLRDELVTVERVISQEEKLARSDNGGRFPGTVRDPHAGPLFGEPLEAPRKRAAARRRSKRAG